MRRFSASTAKIVGIMAAVFLLLAACAPAAQPSPTPPPATKAPAPTPTAARPVPPTATPAPQPKYGGTLSLTYTNEAANLDVHLVTAAGTLGPMSLVYDRLVQPSYGTNAVNLVSGNDVQPGLALKWETSADGLSYVFFLRKGVKFHNIPPLSGRELTAEDVVWSFNRMQTITGGAIAPLFKDVQRAEKVDDYTVRFVLKSAFPDLLGDLVGNWFWVAPKEIEANIKTTAVGTGPYVLKDFTRGVRQVFEKNPDYWIKGVPYIDRIERLNVPDTATAEASFTTGRAAELTANDSRQFSRVQKAVPDMKFTKWDGYCQHVVMRNDEPPFNDLRVRQAIALGIDRQTMIDALQFGEGNPCLLVPPSWGSWTLPASQYGDGAKFLKRDVTEAKRLLAVAGYPNGFNTKMNLSPTFGQRYMDQGDVVATSLKELGINVTLVSQEYAVIWTTWTGRNYEGMTLFPQGSQSTLDAFTWDWLYPNGRISFSKQQDPKALDLLERTHREYDPAKRKELSFQLQQYALVQNFDVPLVTAVNWSMWQPWVKNYAPKQEYGLGRFTVAWLEK